MAYLLERARTRQTPVSFGHRAVERLSQRCHGPERAMMRFRVFGTVEAAGPARLAAPPLRRAARMIVLDDPYHLPDAAYLEQIVEAMAGFLREG
ncbi:hypothetical protein [Nonomuraea basaltis]|uniref:hypothetical protein n=1 Tax=Nonomuraea basaltis TaxID=2495887 RepID=UPI00110C47B4|nr:hypothetical protein [Nonomuraea basaltis]TMR96115.1 hypothetical protein EJK15_25220 [Nonomuraea basaltis]